MPNGTAGSSGCRSFPDLNTAQLSLTPPKTGTTVENPANPLGIYKQNTTSNYTWGYIPLFGSLYKTLFAIHTTQLLSKVEFCALSSWVGLDVLANILPANGTIALIHHRNGVQVWEGKPGTDVADSSSSVGIVKQRSGNGSPVSLDECKKVCDTKLECKGE